MKGVDAEDRTAARVLEVRVAGPMELRLGDRVAGERELGGRRPRLLLAALALQPGAALGRDALAEVLWGEDLPATWTTALRVAASKARAALAVVLDPDGGSAEGGLLVATRAGYALELPAGVVLDVDLVTVRRLLADAEAALAEGDALAAAEAVARARPTLERPLLGDEGGPWVERQRDAQREDLVRAVEVQAEARLALRDPVRAAAAAADALELAPYRESAHRLLITAHRRAGNEGEALRAYERCRRRLAEDLGTVPSPETQELYQRLLGEEPDAPGPSLPLPGRLRLVGRERPLATLERLLTTAIAGQGAVALVTGEPGIGKTRVARELADRAAAVGMRVLWGTCREPEWAPPLGALVDLLPGLVGVAPAELTDRLAARLGDAPGAPPPEDDRLRLREDLRRALLAAALVDPLLVVVDDLQWADDGTLAALRHLGPSLPNAPVLVVATVRDEALEPEQAPALAIAALSRDPGVARVPLAPLGAAEVEELVTSVHPSAGGWAGTIHADTGGNPFFVESVLLHLVESGDDPGGALATPAAVRDVVAQRLRTLGDHAQALLRTASLVEGCFPLAPVGAAADLDEPATLAAVEEGLRARLVEPADEPDTYEFCHAIARQAIAATLPPSRRVRVHRRLAEEIEAACAGSPGPAESGELAGQYHRSASLPGSAGGVEHALRAAEHAEATGSSDRAAAFLGMALDLLPPGDGRRAELTARRGLALAVGPRHAEGARIVLDAADALVAAGDRRAAARLLADAAWSAEVAGHTEDAFSLASSGLELTAGGPEDDVWARLYLLDLRRQEADDPRGLGLPIMTPERRRAAVLLHADPRRRDEVAWAVWDRRRDVLERGQDDVWALTMWAGRFGQALPMWQRLATAAEARGQLAEAVSAWSGAAACAAALGHLADAERWTDRARELARRIELRGAFALHLLSARDVLVHARASGTDDLLEWVSDLTVYRTDRAQRWAEAAVFAGLSRLLAIEGRLDDSRAMLDGVLEVLPQAPATVVGTCRLVGDVVAAAWLNQDTRHLPALADAVRRVLVETDFRSAMTDPRHAQARLLGLGGEVEGARRWFADARAVAQEDGLRPLQVVIDHDEALLLLRNGRPQEAVPLLDAATRRATQLGMVGWVRRSERLALGSVG